MVLLFWFFFYYYIEIYKWFYQLCKYRQCDVVCYLERLLLVGVVVGDDVKLYCLVEC